MICTIKTLSIEQEKIFLQREKRRLDKVSKGKSTAYFWQGK